MADYAIAETDKLVREEETRLAQGQPAAVANDSYLGVGEVIGNLSIVYDWCHDRLTPQQRARWIQYANQAVFNVWHHQEATWQGRSYPWTGWSVDNPSNNYYYSFLRATMLLGLATYGENPQAPGWLAQFRDAKIERQLIPMFNRDLAGGGSREGTGYGTAMKGLFELYYWWEHSTGERLANRTPHALSSIAFMLHSMVPTHDRLAPTGDHARDATAARFDYHRAYLLTLAALFPGEPLADIAVRALSDSTEPEMKNDFMAIDDFLYAPVPPKHQLSELSTAYYGQGTGQIMTRSGWDRQATFANLICGPYTESHAHRDQGSFVLYRGQWLAPDANIYSHSGLRQEESAHNLVRLEKNGQAVRQGYQTSCVLEALADNTDFTYAAARVTPVYAKEPGVDKVEREWVFIKPNTLVVFDRLAFKPPVTAAVWSLNLPGPATMLSDGFVWGSGDDSLKVTRLSPASDVDVRTIALPREDKDFEQGVRIDARSRQASTNWLHVLSVHDSVQAVQRSDIPGQTGAQIDLADGRHVTVRFANAPSGQMQNNGEISITKAPNSNAGDAGSTKSIPLLRTVAELPLYAH